MKNKQYLFIIIVLISLFVACGRSAEHHSHGEKTYVVKAEPIHKTLYFTGTIQPLSESTLTSSMDATVESMHYHFGQRVKKGDTVVTLNSSELQKQYNDTLTDYLKAKDSFTVAKARFTGTQELWKAGLLSKNNYLSEKSSLDTARVTLMQVTRKLTEMLEKMDESARQEFSSLSLAEFDKVRQALTSKHNLIHLKAPTGGVLLYPPKSGEDKTGKLTVGSTVKAGQVIALIGDLTGVSVEIDVPEVDIGKVHSGMSAVVTGIAMGKQILRGELVAVNEQASSGANGALPSFNAIVEVKHLTKEQQSWVKVGMSASIALAVDQGNQLSIPIAAIKQVRGQSVVTLRAKDGTISTRTVITGAAEADRVAIEAGLKIGDVILYGQ